MPPGATHARLLETAGRVFAEAGFQSAKVRDICAQAGVNLAAINYHFGDKLGLYRAVLEYAACTADEAVPFQPELPGRTPEEKLRRYVRGMLEHIYGQERPAWPIRIMTHELAQPTPALDGVVDHVIRPRHDAMRKLVSSVINRPIDDRLTRLCTHSIMGQVMLYAHSRAVIGKLWPELKYTPATLDEIAAHIAAFSYAALKDIRRRQPTRRAATPRIS